MALYSINDAQNVLGCLLNNPLLCLDDKYKLDKYDFKPNALHHIIFISISNLVSQGAKEISGFEIDQYLQNFKPQAEIFNDNNGLEFCKVISELNSSDNIDVFYNNVKKFSVLRRYKENGFDITKFYDESKSESDELSKLASVSVEDILSYYDKLQTEIRKNFYTRTDIEEVKVGDNLFNIKEEFKKAPMFGATTFSKKLNTLTRGWIQGQLTIYSMPSGTGKSTLGIENCVLVSAKEIWDYTQHKFISNPTYTGDGSLYLEYEMDANYEVQPKFLSSISGVPTNHILNGTYEQDEEERVDYAIKVLENSEIYIVVMPSFTTDLIETYCRDYATNKNCQYIVFDYISEQASVNSEIARKNGVTTRSDMVLSTLASKLKDIAMSYNVAVMTFTQCNANIGVQDILDAGCIAGSRAVQNKADIAGIMMPLRPKEEKILDKLMEKKGFNHIKPNRIIHLYKVRFSSFEQGIKLWEYVDLGTGRVIDCFTTTKENLPINIDGIELNKNNA